MCWCVQTWVSSTSPLTESLISSSSLPFSISFCSSPSLMSWTKTTRTSAEEQGYPDSQNSSTGYEPIDHFITEAYVEYTQESLTEQRFPEDFDTGDIGQTFFNACRRRVDHSEGESLSSCLSSSKCHDKTVSPVVCRDASHTQGHEIQRQNSERDQIRTHFGLTKRVNPRWLSSGD